MESSTGNYYLLAKGAESTPGREHATVSPLGINPVGPANHLGTTTQEDGFA